IAVRYSSRSSIVEREAPAILWLDHLILSKVSYEINQESDVQYKLGGLVLLIEGKSTSADGKILFSALATIAHDDAAPVHGKSP
ncbi:MAG TPA: hypothetical protein VMI06_13080, partial [Terriglobia bacterium]|nr:hypothetical protein [Terriglobia bacterium]